MRTVYWILLFLYIGLLFLYSQSSPEVTPIEPWPLLSAPATESARLPASCRTSADCPAHHACLQNACVPKLLRGGTCDAKTGEWSVHVYRGVPFAVCTCKRPDVYNQKYFGGNCDVRVACGLHGQFNPDDETCTCDPGYRPGPNYTCERAPVLERVALDPCGPGEIEVEAIRPEDGFHPDYVAKLKGVVKCVRRPCTFDALSQRPLQHGRFEPNWGCLCDPRYGLFAVTLEGKDKKYLRTPGPDACASIYKKREPWTEVELTTFYYLDQRPPLSFIKFHFAPSRFLPPLKVHPHLALPVFDTHDHFLQSPFPTVAKEEGLIVGQTWPYTYMQHVLENKKLAVRTRECRLNPWLFNSETCDEKIIEYPYRRIPCNLIKRTRPAYGGDTDHVKAYREMYRYPICVLTADDPGNDPNSNSIFLGKTILNPYLLTYQEAPHLFRTNEMNMTFRFREKRWSVDFGDGYRVDDYRRMDTNAPTLVPSAKGWTEQNPLVHIFMGEV